MAAETERSSHKVYEKDKIGEVLSRLKLKKQPDLLVYQDNTLYVHTYSYNYTIEIK